MSAIPPKADIHCDGRIVRFGPITEVAPLFDDLVAPAISVAGTDSASAQRGEKPNRVFLEAQESLAGVARQPYFRDFSCK
jgi:hypothetical protein